MERRNFLTSLVAARLGGAAGGGTTRPRVLAERFTKVAVLVDGTYVVGQLGEKIAGGLFAVDCRVGGAELLLGVFRLDELRDPKTLQPLASVGGISIIPQSGRVGAGGIRKEDQNAA
jgi:hypothetical protein